MNVGGDLLHPVISGLLFFYGAGQKEGEEKSQYPYDRDKIKQLFHNIIPFLSLCGHLTVQGCGGVSPGADVCPVTNKFL